MSGKVALLPALDGAAELARLTATLAALEPSKPQNLPYLQHWKPQKLLTMR
ncbi:hypothetical protein [Lacticaseibacillus pantheris]|uniref:hypothetical protein n=1 Tax=Lacticaseibacillus pantheris TaxID=171523 RepID=UPI00138F89E4|nr:hypothetical protein [Lacticaseibacillus pantheris]